jgi:Glycosyl transferases group 1
MSRRPLRIFVCLVFDQGTSLWHRQFVETLGEMGHNVVSAEGLGISESWLLAGTGQWGKAERLKLTTKIHDAFVQAHRSTPFDLFFAYLYPFQFEVSLFDSIRSLGVPVAYFFCDNLSQPDVAKKYAPRATLNWVPEKAALRQFKEAGATAIHLPMAANPKRNFPSGDPEELDVSFAGGMTPFRRKLFGECVQRGLNLTIYGGGWRADQQWHLTVDSNVSAPTLQQPNRMQKLRHWLSFKRTALLQFLEHGSRPRIESRLYKSMGMEFEPILHEHCKTAFLDNSQLNGLYSRSRVSIGVNDQFCATTIPSVYSYPKMREFEATMAGACYLTQLTDESAELFEPSVEIETYADSEELASKARILLADAPRRNKLRQMGHRRAFETHTWAHRFERLFAELGL